MSVQAGVALKSRVKQAGLREHGPTEASTTNKSKEEEGEEKKVDERVEKISHRGEAWRKVGEGGFLIGARENTDRGRCGERDRERY